MNQRLERQLQAIEDRVAIEQGYSDFNEWADNGRKDVWYVVREIALRFAAQQTEKQTKEPDGYMIKMPWQQEHHFVEPKIFEFVKQDIESWFALYKSPQPEPDSDLVEALRKTQYIQSGQDVNYDNFSPLEMLVEVNSIISEALSNQKKDK